MACEARQTAGLIVVVGMAREARIVSANRATVLIGGGQSERLSRAVDAAVADGACGIISFGLCGGLAPGLHAGDVILQSNDPCWLADLRRALPRARSGTVIGRDGMVAGVAEKADLRKATNADAVDMESHVVISAADRAALPYAVVRAVSDPAERALPSAALAGLKPDGGADVAAVIAALARRPWEVPALLRVAAEAGRAFRSLKEARARLGPRFRGYSAASR